ncbi:MAG: hypothetical protein IKY47_00255, partial [Bacteroidaceae bacterium]|nr:hypothetical protein [Bacteroidaceae bacterium]
TRYLPCGRYDKYDENVGADRRVCPTNTSNAIPGEHTGSPLQANARSILQVWRSQKICKSRRANTPVRPYEQMQTAMLSFFGVSPQQHVRQSALSKDFSKLQRDISHAVDMTE